MRKPRNDRRLEDLPGMESRESTTRGCNERVATSVTSVLMDNCLASTCRDRPKETTRDSEYCLFTSIACRRYIGVSAKNVRPTRVRRALTQMELYSGIVFGCCSPARPPDSRSPVGGETQTSSYGLTAKFVKRSRNKVGTKFCTAAAAPAPRSISTFAYGVSGRLLQLRQRD